MKTDLNTLLTTLYVHLDDRIMPALGFSRDGHPGRKPVMLTDAQPDLLAFAGFPQKTDEPAQKAA